MASDPALNKLTVAPCWNGGLPRWHVSELVMACGIWRPLWHTETSSYVFAVMRARVMASYRGAELDL